MTIDVWLKAAIADVQRRGLVQVVPLLETLARSTAALRAADLAERSRSDRTGPKLPPASDTTDGKS